jgi:FkbM family methyltransferase
MEVLYMQYYSQAGQDRYLNEIIFKGKKGGFFVDIGAHDGIQYSNTYFFERYKNWNGICVEPLPDIFQELRKNRKCICIEGAISKEHGTQEFLCLQGYSEMLSGLVEEFDARHIERIMHELHVYGGNSHLIQVKTFPLQSVFDNYGITHVNFCSIDTEGSELAVLKSIDFSKVRINCIIAENNHNETTITEYLQTVGYILIERLDFDDVFIRKTSNLLKA